ncbi:OmpA family protein [Vibrio sp. ZSDZ34]|jgi:outer membrane protein OmpA-like peptidoglycan-associated protein|uniref:OmpA family protein n=1 Tax=Vibrio gelatinilyticus TaxID=2893468 RepID=A0A9X1WB27_9VIBR|nr:OmpA family protein [Vibrio gelatinilyticus]MCJ2377056.1 OmpA family protein [Vibrio gelatinilyticus]
MFIQRLVFAVVVLALAGCSSNSSVSTGVFGSMLETAPRSESDVLYPEWGDTVSDTARVEGPHGQYRTRSYDSLESYLLANGLDYELLPGDYVMIRLKHKIHFNTASSKVSSQSAQWLSQLGYFLSKQEGIDVVIGGHTDNTGNVKLNDSLSEKRAKRVKQALVQTQVPSQTIYTRGYGEWVPACTNKTHFGKACNRRVELMLIVEK